MGDAGLEDHGAFAWEVKGHWPGVVEGLSRRVKAGRVKLRLQSTPAGHIPEVETAVQTGGVDGLPIRAVSHVQLWAGGAGEHGERS